MTEIIKWTYQWGKNFGFLIPDDREEYGWDFFVAARNSREAKEWDKVIGHVLAKQKWKKPEVKIVEIINENSKPKWPKIITWVYSEHKWDFWFVDVEWREKWYFVFKKDNNNACDWDLVEARIKIYKWKEEAVITKIIDNKQPLILWKFKDQWTFWFVRPLKKIDWEDIFVAWSKKLDANDWDTVSVKIIKTWWRRREWVIKEITQVNPNPKKNTIEEDDDF